MVRKMQLESHEVNPYGVGYHHKQNGLESGFRWVNNHKLEPGLEYPQTAVVGKMQVESHEELVMI